MKLTTSIILLAAGIAIAGCERPSVNAGTGCSLNSDCDPPLVCGLERCRRQCLDSRDCAAGFRCLSIGALGGVCQLEDEIECVLSSDCDEPLVCEFGTCTTECMEDRDCLEGASCNVVDMTTGEQACVESISELCVYNSDCPPGEVCTDDQQCQIECNDDNDDCIFPRICVLNVCELPDAGM